MLRPFLAHTVLALASLAADPPLAGGTLVPATPQTIPSCTAPQPLNLPQPSGIGGGASMAYNGTDFAAAYAQYGAIRFRRFFSDGSPAAPEQFVGSAMTFIPSAGEYTRPALAWDGAGYGVAWFAQVDGFAVPMFRRLNADGTPAGAAVQAGSVGATPTADGIRLALAASPNGFALVWSDDRNAATSGRDLFLTLFDPDGTISNAGAWHDLPGTAENPGAQDRPAIAWNAARNYYTLVWQDGRSGSISEIYSNDLYSWGGFVYASDIRQVTSAGSATEPALAKAGSGYGLVWTDSRSGLLASYFVRLDDSGWLNGTPVQISPDDSESPALAWLGGEFGAVWATAGRPGSGASRGAVRRWAPPSRSPPAIPPAAPRWRRAARAT